MKVQFANGMVFDAADVDEAIAQCLASGNDPFNPVVVQETKQEKKTKNADSITEWPSSVSD